MRSFGMRAIRPILLRKYFARPYRVVHDPAVEAEDGSVRMTRANAVELISALAGLGVSFLEADKTGEPGARLAIEGAARRRTEAIADRHS